MVSGTYSVATDAASNWSVGTVEVSGGRLAYHRTCGSGPAMLLSHGLTDNGLCWRRVALALQADYDVVMLDARGHGETSWMPRNGEHDPARDIAEVVDGLGLKSPILMGHSVGAMATATFANTYPHVASKLILEDPPFLPPLKETEVIDRQEKFRNQVAGFKIMSATEITDMGRKLSPNWHVDEFPAWARGKQQVDPAAWPISLPRWQDIIENITAPTLLVYGEVERGGLVTQEVAADAMDINPNIRTAQIAGAGHNIRRENFGKFINVISNFLNDDCGPENGHL